MKELKIRVVIEGKVKKLFGFSLPVRVTPVDIVVTGGGGSAPIQVKPLSFEGEVKVEIQ